MNTPRIEEDNHVKAYADHDLYRRFESEIRTISGALDNLRKSISALEAAQTLDPGERAATAFLRKEKDKAVRVANVEFVKLRQLKQAVDAELARCKRNLDKLRGNAPTVYTSEAESGLSEAYHRQRSVYQRVREQWNRLNACVKDMHQLLRKAKEV